MEIKLIPFDHQCPSQIEGHFEETSESLIFNWTLESTENLILPEKAVQKRVTGLWKSTCFEVFLKNIQTGHYLEFNFSPSNEWNTFYFESYRDQLTELNPFSPPSIKFKEKNLKAIIKKELLPDEFNQFGLRVHWMTAVLKYEDGSLHYLAPSHPKDAPDFHLILDHSVF